jgi:hypothetical protein
VSARSEGIMETKANRRAEVEKGRHDTRTAGYEHVTQHAGKVCMRWAAAQGLVM